MALDFEEFETFLENSKKAAKAYDNFLRKFMTEMGMRALAQAKALTQSRSPLLTQGMKEKWETTSPRRKGNEIYVYLINSADYASFVEDGHMQYARWVPGEWIGNEFHYIKGAKTGMMLTTKYIEGQHMAQISINKIENEMPARYDRAFKQFLKEMGVD